jgi:hypothetical protein
MQMLLGLLGVALALVAVFVLYIGGAALVLQLADRLRPAKSGSRQEPEISAPTS